MPLFGETQSPYDEIITKVTAETCGTENWRLIFDIVDKVVADPKSSKMCLLSLKKRLNHRDPHVVLLALTVLDTLWSNCGQPFRQEVSSREFSQELGYKATQSNRAVGEKTRSIIKKWAEEDCEKDPSLGLIASLYKGLVNDGYSFETEFSEKKIPMSTDPNVVQSTEEAEAIARAIELSLGETKKETTMQLPNTSSQLQFNKFVERNVRALYDFEAAEDGELTFSTGDILTVLEECDANWWKGRCKGMVGLFPSSFVTTDLSETRKDDNEISANEIQDQKLPQQPVLIPHIDEKLLIQCESLIQECHPSKADPPELLEMERLCLAQEPLIEARVAEIDKQSNALDSTEASIANALSLYDSVIQEQIQFQLPEMVPQQASNITYQNPQQAGPQQWGQLPTQHNM